MRRLLYEDSYLAEPLPTASAFSTAQSTQSRGPPAATDPAAPNRTVTKARDATKIATFTNGAAASHAAFHSAAIRATFCVLQQALPERQVQGLPG